MRVFLFPLKGIPKVGALTKLLLTHLLVMGVIDLALSYKFKAERLDRKAQKAKETYQKAPLEAKRTLLSLVFSHLNSPNKKALIGLI